MNHIDKRRYGDYTINDHYFYKNISIQISSDMRVIGASLFQSQHKQIKKLISLCKNSTDRYHLNILMIITIIYHIYIKCEFYNLEY